MAISSNLLSRFKDARVLVVGDVMLDRFVYGRVSRISPEAPVPVLAVEREAQSLGGAGNVARNIASLGGQATLIGGKCQDEAGARLDDLLTRDGRIRNALVTSDRGRTTDKVRYIADQQQVMRADHEAHWRGGETGGILAAARQAISDHDVLVVSDYAKGFLPPALVQGLIALGREEGKPVIVDPKGAALGHYDGATVITPNKQEAANATGGEAESDTGATAAGRPSAPFCRDDHPRGRGSFRDGAGRANHPYHSASARSIRCFGCRRHGGGGPGAGAGVGQRAFRCSRPRQYRRRHRRYHGGNRGRHRR